MTLGTGIGTGIVIDGRVYNGGLGAAGELGHLPAVKDGRPCGCGKRGCLEKYCSGGGLDITARELLGDGKTARELFSEAKSGNLQAQKAIDDAAVLLGKAVVAAINLISPNVILFSGGMSKQEDFLDAVIAYAKDNCYFSGEFPRLEPALLGELAPLVGASLCDL
jgi:glucokinase